MTRIHARTVVHHLRSLAARGSDAPDDELLRCYLADADESAFAALVRRHAAMVLGVCRRILHHEQDAEDACQATFLVLARNAGAVRSHTSLAAWLHGIARRVSLKARSTRRPVVPLAAVDGGSVPTTELSWREGRAILDEELERLPESLRGPLVLCYFEGLTRDEAAARLGCPLGTLKGRLQRGRELLRLRLTRRGLASSAVLAALALERVAAPAALAACVVGADVSPRVHELARGLVPPSPLTAGRIALGLLLTGLVAGAAVLMLPANPEPPPDSPPARTEKDAPKAENKPRLDTHGDPLPQGAIARLGSLRFFHGSLVRRVVMSPDARLVVSQGEDNAHKLWDAATGKEVPLAEELKEGGTFVFVAGGKLLAARWTRDRFRVWDVAASKEIPAEGIDVQSEQDRALAPDGPYLSPDGKLYAQRDANRIRLFEAVARKELPPLEGQATTDTATSTLHSATFSPDSKRLAVSYHNAAGVGVRVWDVATGKVIATLPGKTPHVFQSAFSADGKTLAAGDGEGITLWDVEAGKRLHDAGHSHCVRALTFTADGKTLLTGTFFTDGAIRVWDATTGRERDRWRGHTAGVLDLVRLPDGKTVASRSQDRTVRLWDVATGKEVGRLGDARESLLGFAFAPDGKTVATGGRGPMRIWDVATGKELRSFGEERAIPLAFLPDGKQLAAVSPDRRVTLWDAATGKEVRRLADSPRPVRYCSALSSDGGILACGDIDGPIHLWETTTGRELRGIGEAVAARRRGAPLLDSLAFSPDGRTLAAGYADGSIRLWEVLSGKERAHFLEGHRSGVFKLVFAPDGSLLASGSNDRTAIVWDVNGCRTTPRGRESVLGAKELLAVWDALADADAATAYRAVRDLAAAGASALPFLKKRLRPAPEADPKAVERLLKELDSDDFATRNEASKGLLRLSDAAEPALRQVLAGGLSAEARRRVEAVLGQLDPAAKPQRLRDLRAVEALEISGTPEARRLLEELAAGAPPALLTRDAQAALRRLPQ